MAKLLRHINILNLILISSVVFLGYYKYQIYKTPVSIVVKPDKTDRAGKSELKINEGKKLLDRGSYMVVSDKNLFHPDRKYVQQQKKEPELPPPDLLLYGTIITDKLQVAYIEDKGAPFNTQGRGQRQRTVHIGDVLGGYTLKIITADMVQFVKDDKVLVVKLIDPKRKSRQATQNTLSQHQASVSANTNAVAGVPPGNQPVQNLPVPTPNIPHPAGSAGAQANPAVQVPAAQINQRPASGGAIVPSFPGTVFR